MIEDDRQTLRSIAWSELLPWLLLFRCFRISVRLRPLVVCAEHDSLYRVRTRLTERRIRHIGVLDADGELVDTEGRRLYRRHPAPGGCHACAAAGSGWPSAV